jgi:hypothetical protein
MSECKHEGAVWPSRDVFSVVWCPECGAMGRVYFHPADDDSTAPLSDELHRQWGCPSYARMWAQWKLPGR